MDCWPWTATGSSAVPPAKFYRPPCLHTKDVPTCRSPLFRRGSIVLLAQQREKLTAQVGILEERAAHHAVGHAGIRIFHAAPVHAEVVGLDHDRETIRLDLVL